MTGGYVYTPHIWPSFLTTILLVVLAGHALRRRSVPGALPFAVGSLFAALWTAGSLMETAAVDATTKVFWLKFQAVWQLPAVSAITCFVLEYTWPGRWLDRRKVALLSIPPLVFLALLLTNDLHHLLWGDFLLAETVIPRLGPGAWVFIVYAYALGLLELVIFAWLFARSPQHRWPVAVMLTGLIGARALYLLDTAVVVRPQPSLDVLLMAHLFLMYALALFAFHIFDPIPLAHQAVIAQMRGGVLVLDLQGRVASVNPATEKMLGMAASDILGRPAQELLAAADAPAEPQALGPVPTEMQQGVGPEARYYSLESSPLRDWRSLEVGRLLLLHDITAQKQAQAQLVEQQRALAMLHERERLARELHDSMGQVFAFVLTQGQTIRRLLSREDVAAADAHVARLVEVAHEAHMDIRESILGLRVALSDQGLFPALTSYLNQYEKQYGIRAELEEPELFAAATFEPLVEVQLLRILQEALTNVRKHAGARCVRIAFALEDGCARVAIRDDGRGFNPSDGGERSSTHIGLQVMRERAQEVGGTLSLRSEPGQGTEVVVRVPVAGERHGEREKRDG